MTVVSLHELLTVRDQSLRVTRSRPRLRIKFPAVRLMPVWTFVLTIVTTVGYQIHRHGLVLGGCAAFVIAAGMVSPIAALITLGLALFFLEARRR